MVIRSRSLRFSSLVLVAAGLAMVLVLAGGSDRIRSAEGGRRAHDLFVQLTAPALDEANLGLGRTIVHIQGRRAAAPVSGPAVLSGSYVVALALAAFAVLVTAERVGSVVLPAQPAPRGPPTA